MATYNVKAFDASGRLACACKFRAPDPESARAKFHGLRIEAERAELCFRSHQVATRHGRPPPRAG